MDSFSHQFSRLTNFFINTKWIKNFEVENFFFKIGVSEKIFSPNTGAKIFIVRKLVRKVVSMGQVLSRKIRVKNFSSIVQFKDGF